MRVSHQRSSQYPVMGVGWEDWRRRTGETERRRKDLTEGDGLPHRSRIREALPGSRLGLLKTNMSSCSLWGRPHEPPTQPDDRQSQPNPRRPSGPPSKA